MNFTRQHVLIIILVSLCARAFGQATVPVDPTPGGGTGGLQDRTVKILGDVANGPSLGPSYQVGPPFAPTDPTLWGPRSYAADGKLVNFSFRGTLGPIRTDQMMVGGFVVGRGGRVVLLRAVGPTLTGFGVSNAVARPQLELFNSAGRSVARAVAWSTTSQDTQTELRTATTLVGAFQLTSGSEDQVLLAHLEAGAYTCVVTNRDATTGLCLLEGYEVPNAPSLSVGN